MDDFTQAKTGDLTLAKLSSTQFDLAKLSTG